jgi:hypothetical protein
MEKPTARRSIPLNAGFLVAVDGLGAKVVAVFLTNEDTCDAIA